jgi:dTDP-4-dehydrorhamnose 3,5-epimerase
MPHDDSYLRETLAAALSDPATVKPDGTPILRYAEGTREHQSRTHVDNRGTVTELFDTRWDWHPDPINFVYTYTIRPGYAKGWGMHREHEDRYFLLRGRMEIVCYDVRPDSATCGQISKIILCEENPRIISIPTFVWHANINIGTEEVRVINFPTQPYNHDKPDKLRLPIDTPLIPYKMPPVIGW